MPELETPYDAETNTWNWLSREEITVFVVHHPLDFGFVAFDETNEDHLAVIESIFNDGGIRNKKWIKWF